MVFDDYTQIMNLMENGCQNNPKIHPKIKLLEFSGPMFEILGGCLRSLICYEVLIGKKTQTNPKNERQGRTPPLGFEVTQICGM